MATNPASKAKLVSSRELSKVVDEAIKAAASRGGAGGVGAGGGHNVIVRPDILGRMIHDMQQAQHFADAVAKGVEHAGVHVQPVVVPLGTGGHLAGFIERDALQIREF